MRVVAVAALAVTAMLVGAPAALAHGLGGVGASSYASTVTGVAKVGSDAAADVPGVTWRVLGGQDYLAVENTSDRDLVVLGYQQEPYLRVGPDGVFENRRSRTTWLNRDRYADLTGVAVPSDVDDDAAPDWIRVADDSSHAWYDHRAQWMNPDGDPSFVTQDPTTDHLVARWEVAFLHDGQDLAVVGNLRWLPPPPAGIGLTTGLALVAIPIVAALAARRRRPWLPTRTAAATMAVLTVAVIAYEIDGILASRLVATGEQVAMTLARLAAMLAVASFAVWRARHRPEGAATPVVLAAAALLVGFGLPEFGLLTQPVAPGVIPAVVGRVLVGASLLALLPATLAAASDRYAAADHLDHVAA